MTILNEAFEKGIGSSVVRLSAARPVLAAHISFLIGIVGVLDAIGTVNAIRTVESVGTADAIDPTNMTKHTAAGHFSHAKTLYKWPFQE